jgi:hypothetical protein
VADDKFRHFDMEGNLMPSDDHPYDVGFTECSKQGCEAKFKAHRWGSIKDGEGWFVKKDGSEAWCPDHLPAWVGPWREKQAAKMRQEER